MNWNYLERVEQLDQVVEESAHADVLIFKHSTRCNISRTALDRFERSWKEADVPTVKPYFLDLIQYRETSNAIADRFGVEHQSPQVLLIRKGQSIYDNSHFGIDFSEISNYVKK